MKGIISLFVGICIFALVFSTFSTLSLQTTSAQDDMMCAADYIVQADDWLSKIADKTYGNVLAYPTIVEATNAMATKDDSYAKINNPDLIEPSWKLCLPSSDSAAEVSEVAPSVAAAIVKCGDKLDLKNAAPPDTNLMQQPDFDCFAWATFIALNWPAIEPNPDNGYLRGFPSLGDGDTFTQAEPSTLLVWETFKEKREVFNINGGNTDPGPWSSAVNYGPLRPAETLQSVPAGDMTAMRTLHQGTGTNFDSLDETVEVASEALEATLPDGSANPALNRPVFPRVWRGTPSTSNGVIYEVKVNYDFYNYVQQNELYLDATAKTNALNAKITLPYRTSFSGKGLGPQSAPQHINVLTYSNSATMDTYQTVFDNMTGSEKGNPPPGIGSVHVKAAWIQLTEEEIAAGEYHTADAQYFVTVNNQPVTQTATFGLVGFHIIQRIHTGTNPVGGTFIFATWEHVKNDTAGFTYANFYSNSADPNNTDIPYTKPITGWYPSATGDISKPPTAPYPVERRVFTDTNTILPNTASVNSEVHSLIAQENSDSVWLNYRLIGTQFMAIDVTDTVTQPIFPRTTNDPTGLGQPLYLANLVLETNAGLQNFQGLPPGVTPVQFGNYKLAASTNVFSRTSQNLGAKGAGHNMGGCMGCHGVAQQKGFAFSFVLLGGSEGAKTDTQTHFDPQPAP